MSWRIIGATVSKDLSLFFRNRFIAVITGLSLIIFLGIYFVMPGTASVYEFGLYAPVVPPVFAEEDDVNYDFVMFDSEEALHDAVAANEYLAGIVLPADIMEKFGIVLVFGFKFIHRLRSVGRFKSNLN